MRRAWITVAVVLGAALLLSSMQMRIAPSAAVTERTDTTASVLPLPASVVPAANAAAADAPASSRDVTGVTGIPEVPSMSEQSLRDEFAALQLRLEANSTDQTAIDRLSSMHALGFFADEIVGFLVGLRRDHPGSYVLTLALADIYVREKSYEDAISLYEEAAPMSDGSLVIDFKLAHARLKSDDPAGALADVKRMRAEVERRVRDKAAGKRTDEGISDAHVMMPCLLEAVVWAKQDQKEAAEKALHDCGKGLLTPDQQEQLRATMSFDVDALRDQDIDTILD